jgi:hypothetical protein
VPPPSLQLGKATLIGFQPAVFASSTAASETGTFYLSGREVLAPAPPTTQTPSCNDTQECKDAKCRETFKNPHAVAICRDTVWWDSLFLFKAPCETFVCATSMLQQDVYDACMEPSCTHPLDHINHEVAILQADTTTDSVSTLSYYSHTQHYGTSSGSTTWFTITMTFNVPNAEIAPAVAHILTFGAYKISFGSTVLSTTNTPALPRTQAWRFGIPATELPSIESLSTTPMTFVYDSPYNVDITLSITDMDQPSVDTQCASFCFSQAGDVCEPCLV